MRRTVLGLAVAAAAVVVGGAEGEYGKRGPRLRFETTTHDYGNLRTDQGVVTHRWIYHNDGDEPLRIIGTRPSCGCTATVVERGEIPPGGRGALEVTFDPSGQRGTVRKTLAVTSNDPTDPSVLLTIRARVEVVAPPEPEPGAHPPTGGQSLLMGDCASCHAEPAAGKTGEPLWSVVCAMCHGSEGQGGEHGPSLRTADYLSSRDDEALSVAIAYGTSNPRMPGFAELMGGPLSEEQVRSLVELVRRWGPLPGKYEGPRD
jgi:mono/diheme cytochrome c family protein